MQIADKWLHQERPLYWATVSFWSETEGCPLSDEFAWFSGEDEAAAWVRHRVMALAAETTETPPTSGADGYWQGSVQLVRWRQVDQTGELTQDWDWEVSRELFSLDQDQKPALRF